MRRLFARNLLFIIGINLLVKPVWVFLIDRTVQNRVGHAPYGTYSALLNLAIIFQIVLDFGLNSYNTKIISQEPDQFGRQFPVMLTARLVLMSGYMALVLGIGFLLGYRGYALLLLCGVVLLQALSILLLFVRSNVAALQRYRLDGILSVTDRFLMILVCGFLLLWPATAHRFRIEWFILAQIGCYAVAVLIGMLVLRRIAHMPQLLSLHMGSVVRIIRKSAPFALLIFLMAVYMRSDSLLVERLCGKEGGEQAGIYASAYRLLDVGNMFSIMFAGILLPLFARMLAERQDVSPIVRLCVNLLLPVSLLVTVTAWVVGKEIMQLLYHQAGTYDGLVFSWLMTSFPAYSMTYVYSTLLTANGHIPLLNKLAGLGAVFNLAVNFYLIPREGALGAAFSTCMTQWLLALCLIWYGAQKNALPRYPRWIGAHLSYLVLLGISGWILTQSDLSWEQKLGVLVVAGLLLVFVFRFISVKALKALVINRPGG